MPPGHYERKLVTRGGATHLGVSHVRAGRFSAELSEHNTTSARKRHRYLRRWRCKCEVSGPARRRITEELRGLLPPNMCMKIGQRRFHRLRSAIERRIIDARPQQPLGSTLFRCSSMRTTPASGRSVSEVGDIICSAAPALGPLPPHRTWRRASASSCPGRAR